jgi:hypothetical protein
MANDLGLSSAYALQGLQQVLAQRKAERIAAQQRAQQLQQQQFENQMKEKQFRSSEELKRATLDSTAAYRQGMQQDREATRAKSLADTIPGNTFLPETDPAAGVLRTGGYGALLKAEPGRPAVPEGPLMPGDSGDARPRGFIKTASAGQQNIDADNARQGARDAEILRHDKAMESKPTGVGQNDNRLDRSYQFNSGQLEKLAKPVEDQAQRLERLQTTLNQRTPQADALLAPELLTVMAGGMGSGLRINEAEIQRVVGGRSNLESLRAAINKWQLDPSKALSVTDAQRGQMQQLVQEVYRRSQDYLGKIDDARSGLAASQDVNEHRRIVTGLHKSLRAPSVSAGPDASAAPAAPSTLDRSIQDLLKR